MIICSINTALIDKAKLYQGKKGKYLKFVLFENEGEDQYGNTHVIKEDLTQEERAANVRPKILGNGKEFGRKSPKSAAPAKKPFDLEEDSNSVPF